MIPVWAFCLGAQFLLLLLLLAELEETTRTRVVHQHGPRAIGKRHDPSHRARGCTCTFQACMHPLNVVYLELRRGDVDIRVARGS